jgi:hypothetical protein
MRRKRPTKDRYPAVHTPKGNVQLGAKFIFGLSNSTGGVSFLEMRTADECRKLAMDFRRKAEAAGVTPRAANVLRNIAKSLTALASQYDMLAAIADDERRQR